MNVILAQKKQDYTGVARNAAVGFAVVIKDI